VRLQRSADTGFADCYTYVGDEKYRKALVSQRRAEYRFCSLVPTKCETGHRFLKGPVAADIKLTPEKIAELEAQVAACEATEALVQWRTR
jgi:hypothetical protein